MRVFILDTQTGRRHRSADDYSRDYWVLACDCCRSKDPVDASDGCLGRKRFLIVGCDALLPDINWFLHEANRGYPDHLVRKFVTL